MQEIRPKSSSLSLLDGALWRESKPKVAYGGEPTGPFPNVKFTTADESVQYFTILGSVLI
jgi:hypothetical protein